MNARNNLPGFTAENAIFQTTLYQTAGGFDRQCDPARVQPAMPLICQRLWIAWAGTAPGSLGEAFIQGALMSTGCINIRE
jgi:hypothetical protein